MTKRQHKPTKPTTNLPTGSVVIIPDDAIKGSPAIFLVFAPWFVYHDGRGYFVVPADETTSQELVTAIGAVMQSAMGGERIWQRDNLNEKH